MFVVTAKMSRKGLAALLAAVLVTVAVICVTVFVRGSVGGYRGDEAMTSAQLKNLTAAATEEERQNFLAYYGWQTDGAPREFYEVTLPKKFDRVYENYNDLQKSQGFDLTRWRGKTVMKYSYRITNYEGCDGEVYATLLVYKNRVIGGDVASAALDGFMHGFAKPAAGGTASTGTETEPELG